MTALVRIEQDRVLADSRDVAADFGKRHDHVLRTIDGMVKAQPDLAPNFGGKIFQVQTGKGGRRSARCFDMDRKGFMLLVMSFSGAKALALKVRWIDAFDQMERMLLARAEAENDDEVETGGVLPFDFRDRMRFVSEARLLGGREAGRRAWREMQLPDVFAPEVLSNRNTMLVHATEGSSEVARWARERLVPCPGAKVRLKFLFADFDEWCRHEGSGGANFSIVSFGKMLPRMGFSTFRSNGSYLRDYVLPN